MRLIRGRPCTIQGTDSDTLLCIPDGVYAALLGNIHTNPNKFRHHIPPNDCLVAPICEYHLHPFIGKVLPKDAKYKICVPHIVRNVKQVSNSIQVRHGDIHSRSVLPVHKIQMNKFEIDQRYVTIHTSHFSGYIVTVEGINCCSKSANVLLFGSLANNPEMGPSVTVKIYLSSIHSQITDYKAVRYSHIFTVCCGKVMFLHLSVSHSVHREGVCVSQHAFRQTPPWQTSPSGQTSPLWADTALGRHPPARHPPMATAVDGTHPTGMHSFLNKDY